MAVLVLAATIAGSAAASPAERPRLDFGAWAKSLAARAAAGGSAQAAKPAKAPKRVTTQEAGCGEIGLECLAGDNISCYKFWICKAKHDPPAVW